jgi:uncharacterized protein (DUF342 family)
MKPFGIIIGGKITAPSRVTAPIIGNIYNIPTEIQVGIVPRNKEKYIAKSKELDVVQKQYDDFKKNISNLLQDPDEGAVEMRLSMYKTQMKDWDDKLAKVKKEAKEAEAAYFSVADPRVHITKTVYPGVIIKIRHQVFEVKKEMSQVVFKLAESEITFVTAR